MKQTACRTIERPDVLDKINSGDVLEFVVKVGGDGQTHLGSPNQFCVDERGEKINRAGCYNEGMVPLILRTFSRPISSGMVLYQNPKPGGEGSLRPLLKSSEKDTADFVVETRNGLQLKECVRQVLRL